MSSFAKATPVKIRKLKKDQAVPCDGRLYRDANGQLWFGIHYSLRGPSAYRHLLGFKKRLAKGGTQ